LTYPRTDSRALPEDYIGTGTATLEELKETNAYGTHARNVLKNKWVPPEQADLRQREDLRSHRDHPDARASQAPQRGRGEALRPRGQALPRDLPPRPRSIS
jgi:DNA topoisomerase IA